MQVTEVSNDGLKRAYSVVVPATDIAAQKSKRLAAIAKDIKIPGFRPGKVPASVIQQRYGQAVMGEVLESSVQDASEKVVSER
ncbi:MAG: trigger factor, partial [Alphaproteobacteria bacterium]|nr:trigger factor [Alphaproteobacteria bacterium]